MKKAFLSFVIAGLSSSFSHAQNSNLSFENFTYTPSVNAWDMIRYGDINTNLHTGAVNFNIPLYVYDDEDITIPIHLAYGYDGFRPNKQAGNVGLGWHLSTGGLITREIKGVEDDLVKSAKEADYVGFLTTRVNRDTDYLFPANPIHWSGNRNPLPIDDAVKFQLMGDPTKLYEQDPDIFHFNFLGYKGSFIFDWNREVRFFNTNFPKGEIWIDSYNLQKNRSEIMQYRNNPIDLTLTSTITLATGDGYKYVFGGNVYAVDSSMSNEEIESNGYQERFHEWLMPVVAWHLSKIICPNGNEITYNYRKKRAYAKTFQPAGGYKMWSATGSVSGGVLIMQGTGGQTSPNKSRYTQINYAVLESIVVNDQLSISFNFSQKQYLETGDNSVEMRYIGSNEDEHRFPTPDVKLDKIQVKSLITNKILRECLFTYKYTAGNPKMLLSKVDISGEGEYEFGYFNETARYPVVDTYAIDHWGYWNNTATRNNFIPTSISGSTSLPINNYEPLDRTYRNPNFNYTRTGALQRITYPTKGTAEFTFEQNDFYNYLVRSKDYYFKPTLEYGYSSTTLQGGMRIKRISFDTGNEVSDKEYLYFTDASQLRIPNYGESSGILLHYPRYTLTTMYRGGNIESGYFYADLPGYNFWSYDQHLIEYSNVIEKLSDGTLTEYSFSTYLDRPDVYPARLSLPYVRCHNYVVTNDNYGSGNSIYRDEIWNLIAEPFSMHNERGRLIGKKEYDSNINLVRKTEYIYDRIALPTVKIWRYGLDHLYEMEFNIGNYDLSRIVLSDYSEQGVITTTEEFKYNNLKQTIEKTVTYNTDEYPRKFYYRYSSGKSNDMELSLANNGILKAVTGTAETVHDVREHLLKMKLYEYDKNKRSIKPTRISDCYFPSETFVGGGNPWSLTGSSKRHTLLTYNEKHRLVQIQLENERYISYRWDARNMYPILKAENLMVGFLDGKTSLQIRNIPNVLVTEYEYEPHIGITKITDPSKAVTTYTYNQNGKLFRVFDTEGNLRNEYTYSVDR